MDKSVEEIKREIFDNPNSKEVVVNNPSVDPELLRMFPSERIERIKKRELRKYRAAQTKKWDNWFKAMSG